MTAGRHAVADLLTDEMRERVRAAEFGHFGHDAKVRARGNGCCGICPLGVALGLSNSPNVYGAAGMLRAESREAIDAIHAFIILADFGSVRPDDIKTMLGCDS